MPCTWIPAFDETRQEWSWVRGQGSCGRIGISHEHVVYYPQNLSEEVLVQANGGHPGVHYDSASRYYAKGRDGAMRSDIQREIGRITAQMVERYAPDKIILSDQICFLP